ncbi:MAG: DNA-directed RNA polymerase subunit L [Candidatus Diapherotrites archaeon]
MELEVLKEEKNLLEFKIKGERHTFPALLKSKLLENPDVSFAAYTQRHPMDLDSQFVVRTKSKDAKKALVQAAEELDEDLQELGKAFKKAGK